MTGTALLRLMRTTAKWFAPSHGLEVLRCFKTGDRFLGNQEIAVRNRPAETDYLPTDPSLTHSRLSSYSEPSQILSGYRRTSLGYSLWPTRNIRKIARPFMQELAEYAQASVTLGVQDRLNMIYIEGVPEQSTVTLTLDVVHNCR